MPLIQYNVVFRIGNATPTSGQIIVNVNELRIPAADCPDLQAYVLANASGPSPVAIKITQGALENTIYVYTLETSNYSTLYAIGDIAAEFAALGFTSFTSAVISIPASGSSSSSGGGAGDPYVTTVHGDGYKLPIMDGPIRFFQGEVDGKTLTVNAQLRTVENSDMIATNLRSLAALKAHLPASKYTEIAKSVFATETLSFFEKFYINYDSVELLVDVWDQKFKVEAYSGGRFPSKAVDGTPLTRKYTGIYDDYASQTIELDIGVSKSAKVRMSVYAAKLLRSGIFIEADNMASGNGVIVNMLSQKDMTLSSLTDLAPVVRKDTRPTAKTEWFMDKEGYRVKTIYVAK